MYRYARTTVVDNRRLILLGLVAFTALWLLLLSHRPVDLASNGVALWWTALCGLCVLNVCGWHRCAAALVYRRGSETALLPFQGWQLALSAVYVLGCGFRSILPRADVQRLSLLDSWLSSVLVGRSVATLAELCFVAQWALLLYGLSRGAGFRGGMVIAWLLVPLIAIAELFSWYAVLSTCYLGNAIEESIWAFSALLLIVACLVLWTRCKADCRPFLAAALLLCAAYFTFMCTVDVPMYLERWQADEASGRVYLTLQQGIDDAWSRQIVTYDWEEWRTEVPWMTLYFSVAVWLSLALIHTPRLHTEPKLAATAA